MKDEAQTLKKFIRFYQEHGEMITKRKNYNEAAHHLVFMAWLQRIVNGGGKVYREYASGLKRMDLLVEFVGGAKKQEFIFELKNDSRFAEIDGVPQTVEYAKRMGKTEAYLIIFRRKFPEDIDTIGERKDVEHDGVKVQVVRI